MYHTVVRSSTLNMIFAVVGMAQKEMTCVNDADVAYMFWWYPYPLYPQTVSLQRLMAHKCQNLPVTQFLWHVVTEMSITTTPWWDGCLLQGYNLTLPYLTH